MSKFQSTISVVAALASIFGAGAAGWKLAQESNVKPAEEVTSKYETHITELQKQISDLEKQTTTVNPPVPVSLPQPVVVKQVAPQPATLPPTMTPSAPPAPPVVNQTTQE
jgi:hypothetical protein